MELQVLPKRIIEFPSGRVLTETDLPKPQTDFGIPENIRTEIDALKTRYPMEKILKAIDLSPDIIDKDFIKRYAEAGQKTQDIYKPKVEKITGGISQAVEAVKAPIRTIGKETGFLPSTLETEMKKRTLEFYPFSDEVKPFIENIRIKDVFNKPMGNTTGEYSQRRSTIPFGKILPEKITQYFPRIPSQREKINLYKPDIQTTAHELLHDIFMNTVAWEYEGFNSEWEKEKINNPIFKEIDYNLFNNPDYKDIKNSPVDLANERFAWLGAHEEVGMRGLGLKKLPDSIKKYYEEVFKF